MKAHLVPSNALKYNTFLNGKNSEPVGIKPNTKKRQTMIQHLLENQLRMKDS